MKKLFFTIFLISLSSLLAQDSELVLYRWLGENGVLGKSFIMGKIEEIYIHIPKDFRQSHYKYGEGVITTLQYADSMYLALHIGFMMSKPFLIKYPKVDSIISNNTKIRFGVKNNSCWKEINYKNLPISIFYENVPISKKDIFDKILDSFTIKLIQ